MSGESAARPTPNIGTIASSALAVVLLAFAVSAGLPKNGQDVHAFKGDEATYYSLALSLASDFDFAFEHKDLVRVWEQFPAGPEGIFLKRGKALRIRLTRHPPFVRWTKLEDPVRTRLYYGKSFIYPLVAAPFVVVFGTSGFFVLHALLLALDLFVVYTFLAARSRSPVAALVYAVVFLAASVVPVYFVWFMPELFNFSVALYAMFLWGYKEVAVDRLVSRSSRFLSGAASDYVAASLIGVLVFSKPTHALLLCPLIAVAAGRRQWRRAVMMGTACAVVAGALFAVNAAVTGEFNYQGGDRKTFYGSTGFPFANDRETFENVGPETGREAIMVGHVLVNTHSAAVFRINLVYYLFGRSGGLVPYLFPGVMSALLFLFRGPRRPWQWAAFATLAGGIVAMLIVWPFTYSGGGGPVGDRYFLSFYPLFLLLTPPLSGLAPAATALVVGALFTAKVVLNPIASSFNAGEHLKSGPLRWLPLELTLLNDLPVAAQADRKMRPLGGTPPVWAYLPDDDAYNPEGEWFWVKGKASTEVILRAPVVPDGADRFVSKVITRLGVDVQNGGAPDRVTVSTGRESRTLDMQPAEVAHLSLAVESGVPYRRNEQPTSYVYTVSVRTTAGFVPFLSAIDANDSRFLGARIHFVPEYADADIFTVTAQDPK